MKTHVGTAALGRPAGNLYHPISSSIASISLNACLFPVRFADAIPSASIFRASSIRATFTKVCAAIKYPGV